MVSKLSECLEVWLEVLACDWLKPHENGGTEVKFHVRIVDDAIRSNLLLKHPTIYNISPLLESYMVKGPASHQMCNTEDLDSTNFLRWRYDSE